MDSKAIDDVDKKIDARKTNANFPISFLDFLNSEIVGKTKSKNNCANDQSEYLISQGGLENDTKHRPTFNSLVDKNTFSKNICDDNQSKGAMTPGCVDNDKEKAFSSTVDKESSDLEDVTLSDDDDFLPTYKSLFERIKRHSSEDNLFKCSPDKTKVKSSVSNNSITSVSQGEINYKSNVDGEIKSRLNSVVPTKLESLNTSEASQSAVEAVDLSKTVGNVDQTETQMVEHGNEDKLFINSKGAMTPGCVDNDKEKAFSSSVDKESSDLEDVTLSDDDDFLPTYKSLFERIKRHSSEDNLFKCSPDKTKVKSSVSNNSITSVSQGEINYKSNIDGEIKSRLNSVVPTKLESLNTSEASQSAVEAVDLSKTVENVDQTETQMVEHGNEDKLFINKLKQLVVPPVKESTSLLVTVGNQVVKSEGGKNEGQEAPETLPEIGRPIADLEQIRYKIDKLSNKLEQLVVPPVKEPTSLLVTVGNQVVKSEGGKNEGQEAPETLPEIGRPIADLERIRYKIDKLSNKLEQLVVPPVKESTSLLVTVGNQVVKSEGGKNEGQEAPQTLLEIGKPIADLERIRYKIDKLSNKLEQLVVPPVKQPTSRLVTDTILVVKSEGGKNEGQEAPQTLLEIGRPIADLERIRYKGDKLSNKLEQLVAPPVKEPTSLLVTVGNQFVKSEGGKNEGQETPETLPEIGIEDLKRICYKAMIFQQTGQVPGHSDSDITESYAGCEELDPKLKNPCPCLCRFYCKNKCKKDPARLSPKGPCRIGKGYASDRRNQRISSCACKILPCSKVAKQTFRAVIGESSNTKSLATCEIDIEKTNAVGKIKLRNQKRTRTIEELNTHSTTVKNYLHDLAAKSKLLAKLELSEQRLKRLANYDASSPVPLFSGMVPVDEDGICDASILSISDEDLVEEQKENVTDVPQTRNLGQVIDLTSDSPPKSPILSGSGHFKQTNIKLDPKREKSLQTNSRKKPTVGRYGVAKGTVYNSDSSDDGNIFNGCEKDREDRNILSKESLQNSQKSVYICDSDEDSSTNVLSKTSVKTTQSTESPKTSAFTPVTQNPRTSLVDIINLYNKNVATESNNTIPIAGYHSSKSVQNDTHRKIQESDRISRLERIDTSKDQWLYQPVASGSKDTFPVPERNSHISTTTKNVPTSIINDGASTSHSELDWETPSYTQGTTYADLLASYAAYDSDNDDRVSFTMGSPESSECLVNEEPSSPFNIVESEEDASVVDVVKRDDVFNPKPSTSATPSIALPSNRVLRARTTPRITQTMMCGKKTVKKEKSEVISTTLIQSPVHNASASDQPIIIASTGKRRGRPRKKPCQQVAGVMDGAIKKVKLEGATADNDESTPEAAKLKEEITAMASQLKKVSAMAARAAQLEKLAMDAKQKESRAVRIAREASAKLRAERLERLKLLQEAKDKSLVEKTEKERKAKELEKEKEKAASEARAKTWECPVCFEPRSATMQLSVTPCGHLFCKPCILEVAHSNGHCPLCNHVFTEAQLSPLFFTF